MSLICLRTGLYKTKTDRRISARLFSNNQHDSTMQIALDRILAANGAVNRQDWRESFIERFWARTLRGEEHECWDWIGAKLSTGYGQLPIFHDTVSAHRFSFELHLGAIPKGQCVCHTCDRRICVNPTHLFLGTPADNNADAKLKGRTCSGARHGSHTRPERRPRGVHHGLSKLTDDAVKEIRRMLKSGLTKVSIAKTFNVSPVSIYDISIGRTWTHIP